MGMEWFKKKGLDKWFQRDNLIILVLTGILLFIIALPTKDGEGGKVSGNSDSISFAQTKKQTEGVTGKNQLSEESELLSDGSNGSLDYADYLEKRLEKMLEGVDGVGQVSVMITLQSSEELVVEKDAPIKQSNIQETDSQGGVRNTTQTETTETTIYRTEGTDSEPYVIKKILPEIEGVLVVAQGAGKGSLNTSISEIVQALFDVEAHKVKVVPMEKK